MESYPGRPPGLLQSGQGQWPPGAAGLRLGALAASSRGGGSAPGATAHRTVRRAWQQWSLPVSWTRSFLALGGPGLAPLPQSAPDTPCPRVALSSRWPPRESPGRVPDWKTGTGGSAQNAGLAPPYQRRALQRPRAGAPGSATLPTQGAHSAVQCSAPAPPGRVSSIASPRPTGAPLDTPKQCISCATRKPRRGERQEQPRPGTGHGGNSPGPRSAFRWMESYVSPHRGQPEPLGPCACSRQGECAPWLPGPRPCPSCEGENPPQATRPSRPLVSRGGEVRAISPHSPKTASRLGSLGWKDVLAEFNVSKYEQIHKG